MSFKSSHLSSAVSMRDNKRSHCCTGMHEWAVMTPEGGMGADTGGDEVFLNAKKILFFTIKKGFQASCDPRNDHVSLKVSVTPLH